MGLNTTVVIYNDALQFIKEDKEFGKRLYDAIMENYRTRKSACVITDFGSGVQDAGRVIEQHHANFDVTVVVGGNTGIIVEEVDYTEMKKLVLNSKNWKKTDGLYWNWTLGSKTLREAYEIETNKEK